MVSQAASAASFCSCRHGGPRPWPRRARRARTSSSHQFALGRVEQRVRGEDGGEVARDVAARGHEADGVHRVIRRQRRQSAPGTLECFLVHVGHEGLSRSGLEIGGGVVHVARRSRLQQVEAAPVDHDRIGGRAVDDDGHGPSGLGDQADGAHWCWRWVVVGAEPGRHSEVVCRPSLSNRCTTAESMSTAKRSKSPAGFHPI